MRALFTIVRNRYEARPFLGSWSVPITLLLLIVWGPSKAFSQTYTWKNVTVPAGGFVSGIEFSPIQSGLVYCRTDIGGVYRWDGTNNVWVPLNDMFSNSQYNNYGGESLAPDPVNANIVYMAAGMYTASGNGVMLRSTDQGNTWTSYSIAVPMGGNNDGRNAGERLAVDPNNNAILFFGSRNNGLWKSTNSAASWAQVGAFPTNGNAGYGLNFVVIDKRGGNASGSVSLYVGVSATSAGSNLYRSTNGGSSWAVLAGGPSGLIATHADLGTDGNLFVTYNNAAGPNGITTGQLWKYNTGTGAWTNVSPANPAAGAGGFGSVSVDAQNAQHLVVSTLDWWGGPDHIYSSTNGGTSWSVIGNVNAGWNGGPFANYNNNGALWTRFCSTNDGGAGWQGDVRIDPFNPAHVIYTTGGGVWDSSNATAGTQPAGVTWTFKDYGLEETAVLHINPSSAGGVFFSQVGDIAGMRHTNLTQASATGMYCNPGFTNTNCLDFAENNINTVVRVGNSSTATTDVAYSTNNGQTWTPWGSAPPGYGTSNEMGSVAVAADGSHVIVAPYNGYGAPAYASSLGGAWTTCTGLPNGSLLASDRVSATTIYATSGATLYRSTNSGASFASVNTFTGSGEPRAVFGQAGEVWVAAGGSGLFRFTGAGATKAQIANVTNAVAVGFGKAASGFTHPAVYLVGTVSGTYGFFRCDDGIGTTWLRINDANHQFGAVGHAGGDETVFGRMYVGTNGRGVLYGDTSTGPTNTPTFTSTPTQTATATPTSSPTMTPSRTTTTTATSTITNTFTSTSTATASNTSTPTLSRTPTFTPTASPSSTPTRTLTQTPTNTVGNTATFTFTPSPTTTNSPTYTRTNTPSATASQTPTLSATQTGTNTVANTATATPSATASNSPTATRSNTPTNTVANTATSTPSNSATSSPSRTATASSTNSATPSSTSSFTPTLTPSKTPSSTPTITATPTDTNVITPTATSSPTVTLSSTPSGTPTSTFTFSLTPTSSMSATPTLTASRTFTATFTASSTSSSTASSTATKSFTPTSTPTSSWTSTSTPTLTSTSTLTYTQTYTPTITDTPTVTASPTNTNVITPTSTNSFTMTASSTATKSFTPTSTATSSWTATGTSTFTPSLTLTPTNSFTSTVTSTPTLTASPTNTNVITPTTTLSFTMTASSTATKSFTPTLTATASGTPSSTSTGSPTSTRTVTPTSSWTRTLTVTATRTTTATWTASFTSTLTLTPIPSATFSPTPTLTRTLTATPSAGKIGVVLYPNPVTGPGPIAIQITLKQAENDVFLSIFTTAFRKVNEMDLGALPVGVDTIPLELRDRRGADLANGLYYIVVQSSEGRFIGKLLISR